MKVLSFFLGFLISLLAVANFGLTPVKAEPAPQTWLTQAVGLYSGSLIYDGGSDLAITGFFLTDSDTVTGSMSLIGSVTPGEEDQMDLGTLYGCDALEVGKMSCYWKNTVDIGGYVEFSFSKDFDEFTGDWHFTGDDEWFTWTGSRLSDLPQVNITN